MLSGRMYCLNAVLKTTDKWARYILFPTHSDEESACVISFGRNRKLSVSENCYMVLKRGRQFKVLKGKNIHFYTEDGEI